MDKLKPCPFCGSKKVIVSEGYIRIDTHPHGYRGTCLKCHSHAYHETKEKAIEIWNRRIKCIST